MEQIIKKAKELVEGLSFEECITVFEKLPKGSPIIDVVFDRMEELDAERFENWL